MIDSHFTHEEKHIRGKAYIQNVEYLRRGIAGDANSDVAAGTCRFPE